MRWFGHRLIRVFAIAFVPMAAAVLVTPAVSSAACANNMSFNPTTQECKQPAPPPAWYTPAPPYAPSFAGQDVPPPPQWSGPPPAWPAWAPHAPMWSTYFQQWGVYVGGVWVPS
jgi:hypothetical protein